MLRSTSLLALAPISAFAASAQPNVLVDTARTVKDAINSAERYRILTSDEEFAFDFANPPGAGETNGPGGHTVGATPSNFPLLAGLGMSMTLGFLGPCGLNTPHTHPRAAEFNIAINGTLRTGLIAENGARLVTHDLKPLQATIFQAGAIHFEQNIGCEPAFFVAAFNDEDPGVSQVAQRFFSLPQDILAATFNGRVTDDIVELANSIPDNVALGTDACLQRCGLQRKQNGGKVVDDERKLIALPAPSITGGFGPGQPAPSGGSSGSAGKAASGSEGKGSSGSEGKGSSNGIAQADDSNAAGVVGSSKQAAAISDDDSSPRSESGLRPFLIALCALNGVLLIALASLAAWVVFARPRRTARKTAFSSVPYHDGSEKQIFSSSRSPSPPHTREAPYDPPMDK